MTFRSFPPHLLRDRAGPGRSRCPPRSVQRRPSFDDDPLSGAEQPIGVDPRVWHAPPVPEGPGVGRVRRALAGLWAIDALLQLQPSNFASRLVSDTILSNAMSQPQPIRGSIVAAAHLLGPHHVALNAAIIVVQLALAAGILWRRTLRLALAASIAWALGVWWLGEGFGGVFAGTATLLVGAPGAAVLYVLLALVVWPRREAATQPRARVIAADGALGESATAASWCLLWVTGAILRVVPFWYGPVYALQGDLQISPDQAPRWLFELDRHLSHLAEHGGLPVVITIAVLEAGVGLGVLTRHRRAALRVGIALSVVYWIVGQQLGALPTGRATDFGTAPLYVLTALTLWTPHRARSVPQPVALGDQPRLMQA